MYVYINRRVAYAPSSLATAAVRPSHGGCEPSLLSNYCRAPTHRDPGRESTQKLPPSKVVRPPHDRPRRCAIHLAESGGGEGRRAEMMQLRQAAVG